MTSELKPCPFCGSARATVTSECDMATDGKFYRIECLDCKAKTKEHYAVETCPIFYESVRNDWNTRATPSVDSHPCNTKDVKCQKIQNLEHKTELENIIQDAVNKTLAQSKHRRGQYIIEDSELQKYATPSADTLAGLEPVANGVFANGNMVGFVGLEGFEFKLTTDIRERHPVVRYDQAAAVVVGLQKKISSLASSLTDQTNDFISMSERAEAAEAELAETKMLLQNERDQQVHEELVHVKAELEQIKAQEHVSDSLKAECDRYKEALGLCQRTLAMIIDPKSIVSTTSIIAFASATEAEAKARAALKGYSHDKG